MVDRSGEFSFVRGILVRIYMKIYLYFHKTYDNHIWHAGTSRGVDSNGTNQAGARDVMTLKSCDFKRCPNFLSRSAMLIKFRQIISKRCQLS